MNEHKKRKPITISQIVDGVFDILYIVLLVITILDMCGIDIPYIDELVKKENILLKFLLIVFASVGISDYETRGRFYVSRHRTTMPKPPHSMHENVLY